MAILEPNEDNNKDDASKQYNYNYYPDVQNLKMEDQMQLRVFRDRLYTLTKEQLFAVALDTFRLNLVTKSVCADMLKNKF